ncbi:MAG: hypothetical protein ABW136_13480 [Steroidobacteraceae bacterium]
MGSTETIYVAVTSGGIRSWRAVLAEPRAGGLYCILSRNDDPEDEHWEFPSGSLVRCELHELAVGLRNVAVESFRPQTPRAVSTS